MSTSTLASFFSKQKQMKDAVREQRLGALNSLKQYRLKDFQGTPKSKRTANQQFQNIPSAYSTMTDIDDFFRQQKQLDLEWKANKEKAFTFLHKYRQENVHKKQHQMTEESSSEDTDSSMDLHQEEGRNDTAIFNVLLMVHAELKQFFDESSHDNNGEDDDGIVGRLSFEKLDISSSNISNHENDQTYHKVNDQEYLGYSEEKKEQDDVNNQCEAERDVDDNSAVEEKAEVATQDCQLERNLSSGNGSKSDDSLGSSKSISEVLDELLEDNDEPFELSEEELEAVVASESFTDEDFLRSESMDDGQGVASHTEKTEALEESTNKVEDIQDQTPETTAPNDNNSKDTVTTAAEVVEEKKDVGDMSPVLDPFSAQERSSQDKSCQEQDLGDVSKETLGMITSKELPMMDEQQHTTLRVGMLQEVPSTPTNLPTKSLNAADSSVSSIGSSSPLPSEAFAEKFIRGGETSLSSGTTFWKNDLPPLPDRDDDYSDLAMCGVEQYLPNLHGARGACERCLALASDAEKAKFEETGRHIRIMIVRGGCRRDCVVFPRQEGEPPVRLCRKCYFDTHRKACK